MIRNDNNEVRHLYEYDPYGIPGTLDSFQSTEAVRQP